ncbi:MAG: lamin tail domain-containing protein, partial [Flammeovirgaceae bacterium]|nr:lamin tail domain-containing protein [Flammeovirgaceae bacterium]MDW8288069.1 lamin tail domain-containing protein [Flammeovirgaceae bacterium]
IDLDNLCQGVENWTSSVDASGGTPGRENSVKRENKDVVRPRVVAVKVLDVRTIEVLFSEELSREEVEVVARYAMNGGLVVREAVWVEGGRSVRLGLGSEMVEGRAYELVVRNIRDCSGNEIESTGVFFALGASPQLHELIITEIMPDPDPVVGLPNAEYVEVYNRSEKIVELSRVRLSDATSVVSLPALLVKPKQYVLLTTTSAKSLYGNEITAVGVSSFPSLNNSGEPLRLLSLSGEVIHEVVYKDTWHSSAEKRNGGWALEMIDLDNLCQGVENWTSSVDASGGTPGRENSVKASNPDVVSPVVMGVVPINSQTIQVEFSERMNVGTYLQPTFYRLSNNLTISQIFSVDEKTVEIKLTTPIANGVVYELSIDGLSDCAGNLLIPFNQKIGIGKMPRKHELLITEIMADPEPAVKLPEREYLELYNPTSQFIRLEGCTLTDATSTVRLPAENIAPFSYLILCSTSAAGELRTYGKTLSVPSFPSLNNTGERLVIRNSLGEVVFEITYSDKWYGDEEKRNGGWSLEMRDITFPCGEAENWQASVHPRGGTPAEPNSVKASLGDNIPPQFLDAVALSDNTVLLVFNEKLDSTSVFTATYSIANTSLDSILFDTNNPTQIILKIKEIFRANQSYEVSVLHLQDCSGNTLANAVKRTFVMPDVAQEGDILL